MTANVIPLSGKPTFGAGRVFGVGAYANPTPARALVPQSQSIDFKRKTESLFGENQLPVAIGAGEMDISAKVEYGKINARIISDMVFGDTPTVGSYFEADGEAVTAPAASPYSVAVANATNFLFDLGVVNATTGAIYTCVAAGSEVAGASYSVATTGANKGKYTFALGDASANMTISYAYSLTGLKRTIKEYLRENFYGGILAGELTDQTAGEMDSGWSMANNAYRAMVNVIGIDRIVFTTDYPFGNMKAARQFFDQMPISHADKEKIAHGNAERLFANYKAGSAPKRPNLTKAA